MPHPQAKVHRMYELIEPIATITYSQVPTDAFLALGMRNYWDGYFAGRAAPLGQAPAEVVHAVFYNFADGEVARHIPWVWGNTTPDEAIAVREQGSATALRQTIGQLADTPALARVADLATRAALSAPTEGRALYAGLRALDVPDEPVARLWHAATLLREHRGDGHNAALVAHGIRGTEAHVLMALALGMPAEKFGRIHHLPTTQLAAVVDGLRDRGLVLQGQSLELESTSEVMMAGVGLVPAAEAGPAQRVLDGLRCLANDVEQASDLRDGQRDHPATGARHRHRISYC